MEPRLSARKDTQLQIVETLTHRSCSLSNLEATDEVDLVRWKYVTPYSSAV